MEWGMAYSGAAFRPSNVPVEEGKVYEAKIEDIGREGDGLARILDRIRAGSGVEREASYGPQQGLLANVLLRITLATSAPFFCPSLAYVLMSAAGALALLGWRWADRVPHLARTQSRVPTDAQT